MPVCMVRRGCHACRRGSTRHRAHTFQPSRYRITHYIAVYTLHAIQRITETAKHCLIMRCHPGRRESPRDLILARQYMHAVSRSASYSMQDHPVHPLAQLTSCCIQLQWPSAGLSVCCAPCQLSVQPAFEVSYVWHARLGVPWRAYSNPRTPWTPPYMATRILKQSDSSPAEPLYVKPRLSMHASAYILHLRSD